MFCHIISITFVHFDGHSFIVLKKARKKGGTPFAKRPAREVSDYWM
jgi:hypothetical protein